MPTDTDTGRMGRLARLPVFLALGGKRAVVVGGSEAATWKAELLSAAGAAVDVIALEPCDAMLALAAEPPYGSIAITRRQWTAADFSGAAAAIGAIGADAEAARFAEAVRAAGVPVNVIDKPALCDFSFGSIVNRSPLVIGISTDGAAPVFAQAVRARLEALLPRGFADWVAAATRWRNVVKQSGLSFGGRRRFWQLFTAHALQNPDRAPRRGDVERLLGEAKGLGDAANDGSVMLVGAGPGDPELLTLRAVRALQSADVILYDHLVSRDVLDFARREARKLLVGKTGHGPSCKQADINALMVGLARQGKRVVRLKGGDPLIFARAGEEIAACEAAGIAVEVVPGITAAQGAAARLRMPLTGRGRARRVQFVTGHASDGQLPADIDWQSVADPAVTTAIYMPKRTLADFSARAIAAGLSPHTPAVAIAGATRPDELVVADTIAGLPARPELTAIAAPVLILVGTQCDGMKEAPAAAADRCRVMTR